MIQLKHPNESKSTGMTLTFSADLQIRAVAFLRSPDVQISALAQKLELYAGFIYSQNGMQKQYCYIIPSVQI